MYVEYKDAAHETEYYDIATDPYEQNNVAGSLTATQRNELHKVLSGLRNCHSASSCWAAGLPGVTPQG